MDSLLPVKLIHTLAGRSLPDRFNNRSMKSWLTPRAINLYLLSAAINAKDTIEIGCRKGLTSVGMALWSCNNNGGHVALDRKNYAGSIDKLNSEFGLSMKFICADAHNWEPQSKYDVCYIDIGPGWDKNDWSIAPNMRSGGLIVIPWYNGKSNPHNESTETIELEGWITILRKV